MEPDEGWDVKTAHGQTYGLEIKSLAKVQPHCSYAGMATGATTKRKYWRFISLLSLAAIGIYASIMLTGNHYRVRPFQPALVAISFAGYTTNEAGERCLTYRVQNNNRERILGLAEFKNSIPGSGLFINLPTSQPQTFALQAPRGSNPCQLSITCFIKDRGVFVQLYNLTQRIKGGSPRDISKLLFKVPGPIVEP